MQTKLKIAGVLAAGVLAAAGLFAVSPTGVQDLQAHEATKFKAYRDSAGVPTICTGSTRAVRMGSTATPAECEARLRADLAVAEGAVRSKVTQKITQGQYDALVSFTFNVGITAFGNSTLLKLVNSGQCHNAADQFKRWVYAGGKRLNGLANRRADEADKFRKDCGKW